MTFRLIPGADFDSTSAGGPLCYVTGERKQEGDAGIFRGPVIDHEGYLDVSVRCITTAASKVGWISPENYEQLEVRLKSAVEEYDALKTRYESQRELLTLLMKDAPDVEILSCKLCDYMAVSEHGLKVHMGKAHSD